MTNAAQVGSELNAAHPKGLPPDAGREAQSSAIGRAPSWTAVVLCFAAILFDGLDTSSIGVAGPAIAAHFNVPPASLTAPFVTTSLGAVIGYLISGSVVGAWGSRRVLIASVVSFGLLSLATPLTASIAQLAALRLITAIGLGLALPSAISIATMQCPSRLREAVTVIVGTGLAAGGVLGGVLGGILTLRFGWQILFYAGGALPLVLSLLLLEWLPRPVAADGNPRSAARDMPKRPVRPIADLLAGGRAIQTIGLWAFSLLIFADAYALVFWLPSLLIGLGFPPAYSQLCVGFFSAGGLGANIVVMVLVSRFAIARVMLLAACLAAVCAVGLSLHAMLPFGVWLPVAGAGAGLIACSVGQSALAVSIYPEPLRTNGVGFSAAAGRIGSIIGPAVAGMLVSLNAAPNSIVLAAALPALLATCVLLVLARSAQRENR